MTGLISENIFYIFRKSQGLTREQIADKIGISLKRWTALETWKAGSRSLTLEEIVLLDKTFGIFYFREFFIDCIYKEDIYNMPRRVERSSDLLIYLSLSKQIMYLNDVAIALSCSTAKAVEAMKVLRDYAENELNLRLPPSGGIQTVVFEKCFGYSASSVINAPEVQDYLTKKGY